MVGAEFGEPSRKEIANRQVAYMELTKFQSSHQVSQFRPAHSLCLESDPRNAATCRSGNPNQRSIPKRPGAIRRWLHRRPRLYGWLREMRSCFRRMTLLSELHAYSDGIDLGPMFQPSGFETVTMCKQTLACRRDMLRLAEMRPDASLLDLSLYVDGWKEGAEWGRSQQSRCDS
jgi:hypothetical protein